MRSAGAWSARPAVAMTRWSKGPLPHLGLDILARYAEPNQFKALAPEFVGHIDFAFATRSLQCNHRGDRIFLLHRQPAVPLDHPVGHADHIRDLRDRGAGTLECHAGSPT